MGCSTSKLDDEEAVQLCKDRKKFIKQAVEHRMRFASGHAAYIQSLKRVSAALRDYIEEDEPREFMLDAFTTPAFTPVKKPSSTGFISISPKPFTVSPIQSNPNSTIKVNYLRSGGNPAVSVEERPHSPETVRLEAYSPIHQYGMDGFFAMQSPPVNNSFFSYSPIHRTHIPPPSPQTSQWDFFWNPFSSLDNYGYPTRSSLDHTVLDDITGLRQVREEEGIPELEEETEEEEEEDLEPRVHSGNEQAKVVANGARDEVIVEDDNSDDDDYETDSENESEHEVVEPLETKLQVKKALASQNLQVSKSQNAGQISNQEAEVSDNKRDANEETPGFTVYVNRRPTNMTEVIKDLETQFKIICNSATEVSTKLEASRAQYSSASNELTAIKMLNPVALLRSASSRSSSSRFVTNYSSSKDEAYESSSDFSEESCTFVGSHQSTLDKLYAWEKKLYHEVRAGERIRIAYEKKCSQLQNQDVKGDDPSSVDKTRAAIRDLHTQIKVSIHSVEAVSNRIEILRDEELQPQLLDLIQGLTRMWKVMSECHLSQKRILDDAKLLLAGTPSKLSRTKKYTLMSPSDPHRLACAAANLESELRNWRACFESWITSQRSYIHALTGWLLRCLRSNADASNLPFSPRRSIATSLPIYGICVQWSRFLDAVREIPVLDGLDFFVAGVGSLYAQQLKEDYRHRTPTGSKRYGGGFSVESSGNMEMVEVGHLEEDARSTEKMVEVAIRVLCAGMSVAVSSLTEYAMSSAEGYADLVKQWGDAQRSGGTSRTQRENP